MSLLTELPPTLPAPLQAPLAPRFHSAQQRKPTQFFKNSTLPLSPLVLFLPLSLIERLISPEANPFPYPVPFAKLSHHNSLRRPHNALFFSLVAAPSLHHQRHNFFGSRSSFFFVKRPSRGITRMRSNLPIYMYPSSRSKSSRVWGPRSHGFDGVFCGLSILPPLKEDRRQVRRNFPPIKGRVGLLLWDKRQEMRYPKHKPAILDKQRRKKR